MLNVAGGAAEGHRGEDGQGRELRDGEGVDTDAVPSQSPTHLTLSVLTVIQAKALYAVYQKDAGEAKKKREQMIKDSTLTVRQPLPSSWLQCSRCIRTAKRNTHMIYGIEPLVFPQMH